MPTDLKSRVILLAACIVSFGAGYGITFLSGGNLSTGERELRDTGHYAYISPLLECSDTNILLPQEVREAEQDVREIIERHKKGGNLSIAAVYFRDLNNGPWFGVNVDTLFVPGSLLKVPMMISYLKILEQDPSLAEQEILYEQKMSAAIQNVAVADPLTLGERYSPDELLRRMITQSDNESAYLLYSLLGDERVGEVYTELGLGAPFTGQDYNIRVRDYATFFRILYNATYLSPESSERALELLVQTDFDKGIAAGIPANIPVANKFGERNYVGTSETQLHDCGIVYAKERPYSLCVMTRGTDIDALSNVIREISSTVYARINSK
ncbi:MAG TPA: serine hydrolase [Candidatus Paceibacterota bacterium]|nr:serine hydrolase [Candidatus Paceibacterota bacterium]